MLKATFSTDFIDTLLLDISTSGRELDDIFRSIIDQLTYVPASFRNDLQVLSSSYSRINHERGLGIADQESYNQEATRVTKSLVEILEQIRYELESKAQTANIMAVQMAIDEENFRNLLSHKLGPDFEIVKALSKGEDKYAIIYEVIKKRGSWQERFALKVFKTLSLIDQENQALVQKELETISEISKKDNNNLISVDYENQHFALPPRFILSPFTEGENLRDLLHIKKRKFTRSEIWDIIHPLFKTVNILHEKGLVHENLRPSNILIQETEFDITPWLFAPKIVKGIFYKRICGILSEFFQYWSPEQIEEDQATAMSDQYALGLILLELFTGTAFFEGKNIPQLVESRMAFEKEPAKKLEKALKNTICPAEVLPVIEKMLHRDPEQRFSDLLEAHQLLRNTLR